MPNQPNVGRIDPGSQSIPQWQPSPPKTGKTRRLLKSKLFVLLLAGFIIFGASSAAYFGYYQPNQPENIWTTALNRSSKGYDKLAEYISESRESKGLDITGSFKLSGDIAADGTFEGKSSDDNGDFKGSISAAGVKVNLELKTIKSPGNSPDIYFKLNGLEGLGTLFGGGDSQTTEALNSLNDQWYFIDHTLFDQLAPGTNTSTQITGEDVSSILKAIGDATKEFVFTDNSQKSVLVLKEVVGKERVGDRDIYHYNVGFSKQNLTNYVNKLCENLKSSKLNKFFNGDQSETEQVVNCEGLKLAIGEIDESKTADVWVDLKTKLIHKIRFSYDDKKDDQAGDVEIDPESTNPGKTGYVEIIQNYNGGDTFPLTINFSEDETFEGSDDITTNSGSIQLTLNMETDNIEFTGSYQTKSPSYNSSASFNLSITPLAEEVRVEKPAKSKNLIQLINDVGWLEGFGGELDIPSSRDTERKTDINALHGQIEAFNAQYGYYPTLANINDASWRQTEMVGLDPTALQDPKGSSKSLASSPAKNVYSYQVRPANCNNDAGEYCLTYILTAQLEGGGNYTKESLN